MPCTALCELELYPFHKGLDFILSNRKALKAFKQGNNLKNVCIRNIPSGTCLVAQWLRIRLPMQGTRVQPLVQEDPTCRGATKPVGHNY